jgi:hypothetical protein
MARGLRFVESKLTMFWGGLPHFADFGPDCGSEGNLYCRRESESLRLAQRGPIFASAGY